MPLFAVACAFRQQVRPDVFLGDEVDSGKGVAIDLVAYDVIIMPVRVDNIAHGFVRKLAQRRERLFAVLIFD